MHYQTGPFFYSIAASALLVFMFGIGCLAHIWNLGKNGSKKDHVLSKWIASFIRSVFLQQQIRKSGMLPWIIHLFIFYGFISLLLLTSIDGILTWFVPHDTSLFLYFTEGKGSFFLALWGDFWGLILLIGVLAAVFRRYVLRPETFYTVREDVIAIWFLLATTVTGFMCEAVRLAINPAANDAPYSFAVMWLVPYMSKLHPTQATLTGCFYIHAIVSLAFIAYIPFSKLKHVFMSPITFASVSTEHHYTRF